MRNLQTLLLLALLIGAAQAKPLSEVATENGFKLWGQMLAKLGLTKELTTGTFGTLFCPTDRAIAKFLGDMAGLSFQQLLDRPQLVDLIVSAHLAPGVAITDSKKAEQVLSKDAARPTILASADLDSTIQLVRSQETGLMLLRDMQGNTASVLDAEPVMALPTFAMWSIGTVLMSASYFDAADDVLRFYPSFSTFFELKNRANTAPGTPLATRLLSQGAGATYFWPVNSAFRPGQARALAADEAIGRLANLVEYHVLEQLRPVPTGFRSGVKLQTLLAGHKLTTYVNMNTERINVWTGKPVKVPTLAVVPEAGKPAQVTLMNLYAGKDVIQAINGVLTPYGLPTAAAAKAAVMTEAGAAQRNGAGRRLLGGRAEARATSMAWAAMNTQDAIRAAARGAAPTEWATTVGSIQGKSARCLNCAGWGYIW